MAVCHHQSSMLYLLMITLQILGLYPSWLSWTFTIILNGHVLLGYFLPCFLKGTAATQTTFKVHLHQRDSFLQLLAVASVISLHERLVSLPAPATSLIVTLYVLSLAEEVMRRK